MTAPLSLAAVLAAGEPERLYSGLSVLVSSASEQASCAALATFRALELMMDPDLSRRVRDAAVTPALSAAGRERFGASLAELLDVARDLETLKLYACSASVDAMSLTAADVEARLDGVMSTPRFLRDAAAARLIFV